MTVAGLLLAAGAGRRMGGPKALVELDADSEEEFAEAEERLLRDDENGPPMLRVRISGTMARAFAKRAMDVVNAGRPPCRRRDWRPHVGRARP